VKKDKSPMYQAVYDAQFQNYIDVIKEGESDFIIPLQETYYTTTRNL
jgi:FMN-dependent NADH-azoreductase